VYENVKGKKLLILGGGSDMVEVTKLAQSMGCTVYVMDYYDTLRSPAKLVADQYSDISIADYDLVVGYIKANGIDGVITGYTDSYLEHYLNICELAGLPHYGNEKSFGIAANKMLFKNACREAGVGIIPGTNAYDFETVEQFAEKNGYPLILKPVDNSGSRGVIKCEEASDLRRCYDYALSFSYSDNVIVERFMDCDSVVCSYQFDGKTARLSALCDREIYKAAQDGSAITREALYPSKYLDRFIAEQDSAMKSLFEQNDFSDGMLGVMGFVDDESFYWCEMTYRPSAGHHYTFINDQNGINGLALFIEFAVTGRVCSYESEKESPYFKEYLGMVHILGCANKKIASIKGVDTIAALPYVLEVCSELRIGQTTGKDGTTAQTLLSVWLKGKDFIEYSERVDYIKSVFEVYDEDGEMIVIK